MKEKNRKIIDKISTIFVVIVIAVSTLYVGATTMAISHIDPFDICKDCESHNKYSYYSRVALIDK